MTLTAMRPDLGVSKSREVSLLSVVQASSLISALRVIFERLVGIVRTQEIGVADEEALLVVVGVDEPAGDALRTVAAHLAGLRVKDIHTVDLHLNPAILCREAVRDGRLKILFGPKPAALRAIHVVYPSRLNLPAKVRLFVDALATLAEPMLPLHSGLRRKRS